MNFLKMVGDINPEANFPFDHDDAIIGMAERKGKIVLVLSTKLILEKLQERDGMGEFEAHEYFLSNMLNAWMGSSNPFFADDMNEPIN